MGKHERSTPKMRAASGSRDAEDASASASRSPVSTSFRTSNPFVKGALKDAIIAKVIPSGTRNKNSGFDGISKRKRVRLDKREKKKEMALAGKLKRVQSQESPSVPLEVRAKRDAAKERERKKRQKLAKKLESKRAERSTVAASAPTGLKKRRSRSQVAADSAAAAAAAAASSVASLTGTSQCLGDASSEAPSKKMIRKLQMTEKRAAAKAASTRAAAANAPGSTPIHETTDTKKRHCTPEASRPSTVPDFDPKKHRSASDFPYAVDTSDHAETPSGERARIHDSYMLPSP
jgi:hypothetical protein